MFNEECVYCWHAVILLIDTLCYWLVNCTFSGHNVDPDQVFLFFICFSSVDLVGPVLHDKLTVTLDQSHKVSQKK